jgi:hypothetical protein
LSRYVKNKFYREIYVISIGIFFENHFKYLAVEVNIFDFMKLYIRHCFYYLITY